MTHVVIMIPEHSYNLHSSGPLYPMMPVISLVGSVVTLFLSITPNRELVGLPLCSITHN